MAGLEEPEEGVDGVLLVHVDVVEGAGRQVDVAGVRLDARGGFADPGLVDAVSKRNATN